jgi:hypothetical protein
MRALAIILNELELREEYLLVVDEGETPVGFRYFQVALISEWVVYMCARYHHKIVLTRVLYLIDLIVQYTYLLHLLVETVIELADALELVSNHGLVLATLRETRLTIQTHLKLVALLVTQLAEILDFLVHYLLLLLHLNYLK